MNKMIQVTEEQFWSESSRYYIQPKVQSSLLRFQDEYDCNVNVMLFMLFLDKRNICITEQQLMMLTQVTLEFSQQYTQSLRALRKDFKQNQTVIRDYETIRTHLLEAELALERQEQSIIINALTPSPYQQVESERANTRLFEDIFLCQHSGYEQETIKLSDLNQLIR